MASPLSQVIGSPQLAGKNTQMENQTTAQTPTLDRAPFHLGGGQTYTMMASPANGGYDGSGINPGGTRPPAAPPVQPPTASVPVTTPAGPSTPVAAPPPPQNLGPTAANPLAPLNDYRPQ
jgi:hypothetical protein